MTRPESFKVRVLGSTPATVDCGTEQPLLDAFLRSGVYLPNSWNQGTCGTCKVRLVSGTVKQPAPQLSVVSADEQPGGFVLACQASPTSDTTIELDAGTGPRHVLRDLTGTVAQISAIAADTLALFVDVGDEFDFTAGQYVEIRVPGTDAVRQYSMANRPGNALELHIRRVPGGRATDGWIFASLSRGDTIELCGPWGDFVYAEDDGGAPIVMLGGGTGLAPLKAIALEALAAQPDREITVYHGVRTRAELYDVEFWEGLTADHSGVRYVPCLSRETWDGRSGYVGDALLEDFASLRGHVAYLCGPAAMVDAGVKACKRRRMAGRAIRREKYVPATDSAEALPV